MNEPKRGSLYLVTGVLVGLIFGLVFSLKIHPVQFVDASPDALNREAKNQYRIMIARAYMANGDLVRAKARLDLLGDRDLFQTLSRQAQLMLAQDNQSDEARALGILAVELGKVGEATKNDFLNALLVTPASQNAANPPAISIALNTQAALPNSATPDTSIVLVTPTPVSAGLFVLQDLEKICEPRPAKPLFQIEALDKSNTPLPSVLIIISWKGGTERIYTGLYPDKGLGYAQFEPTPGVMYTLQLEENGIPIQDLTIAECQSASGESYPGSWLFRFIKS